MVLILLQNLDTIDQKHDSEVETNNQRDKSSTTNVEEHSVIPDQKHSNKVEGNKEIDSLNIKHSGTSDRPICDKCDARLKCYQSLKRHTRMVHAEKVYKCIQCPNKYGYKSILTEHVKQIHGPPRYECSKCSARFRTNHSATGNLTNCLDFLDEKD